jgi:hypothetical protein
MLRQSQQQRLLQRLSPQQIQIMKLLQVPTANLEERIKEELEENPALEYGEEGEANTDDDIYGLDKAEGAEDDIYRLARRQAKASQGPIKPRRFDRRLITQHVFYLEYAQRSFHSRRVRFVARALQAFKQDKIADDNVVWIRDRTQFRDRRTGLIAEMRDPDRGIDNDHETGGGPSRRIVSRSPSQPIPAVDLRASRRRFWLTTRRNASSTVAFLVARPVAAIASLRSSSSISILVRIEECLMCTD